MPQELDCGRCRLRPFRLSDAPDLAPLANDRDIWLNLRDAFPHPYGLADAERFVAMAAEHEPARFLAITVDGRAVGSIGLHLKHDVERFTAELGYWLGRPHWGKGIVTDAVRGIVRYGFDELKLMRIFALPYARNAASCRVLEKAGFQREGLLRKHSFKNGVFEDQPLYARVQE